MLLAVYSVMEVLETYTTNPSEAQHYIQYDQGRIFVTQEENKTLRESIDACPLKQLSLSIFLFY